MATGSCISYTVLRETLTPTTKRRKPPLLGTGLHFLSLQDFVPALDAVTPPLAGISRITRLRFLAFDGLGAGLYSSAYIALGYLFSNDLDRAAAYAGKAGTVFGGLLVVALLILGGRHLLRRYLLTYEFGSRWRYDLIGLNLKPPSPLHTGSLKASNISTKPVAQADTVRHAATH